MTYQLHHGDNMDVLKRMIEQGVQVDAVVTDPPYGLTGVSRKGSPRVSVPESPFGRHKLGDRGFMGMRWDASVPTVEFWRLVYQVLKPGGHVLSFGGTRTYHRVVVAIEDAGFDIRDQVLWLYGVGFPKSLDVSKAIDKLAGAKRPIVGSKLGRPGYSLAPNDTTDHDRNTYGEFTNPNVECQVTDPVTTAAKKWQGFGTALKPAFENIVLARKPLIGTIVENVLKHGTGALNIDACRIPHVTVEDGNLALNPHLRTHINGGNGGHIIAHEENRRVVIPHVQGRYPANLILDEEAGVMLDAQSGVTSSSPHVRHNGDFKSVAKGYDLPHETSGHKDLGGASRFFYCTKASKRERRGSKHPTIKPISLLRYLCRLVVPPSGTVLDPFAGSGTTGEAAVLEGFFPILIEREAEYIPDIERRMADVREEAKPTPKNSRKPMGSAASLRSLFEDEGVA